MIKLRIKVDRMSKGIVIFDSNYGNTEKVARALATGIKQGGVEIDCVSINGADVKKLIEYNFLAIGGPTHIASMSKPMKEFLEKMAAVDVRGAKGFCFDTRNPSRFNTFDMNSAAKRIEKKMKKMNVKMIRPRESALVEGREGPLHNGVEDRFTRIGAEIAESIL
jgi:flavodoxin